MKIIYHFDLKRSKSLRIFGCRQKWAVSSDLLLKATFRQYYARFIIINSTWSFRKWHCFLRGVAKIFQRGGHTVSKIIDMPFSPRNIIDRFLKKGLQGGGVTGTPAPPSLRPCSSATVSWSSMTLFSGH